MSEEERKRRVAEIRRTYVPGHLGGHPDDVIPFLLAELDRVTAEKRLGWERHAEKDRAYQTALDERDAALEQVRGLRRALKRVVACGNYQTTVIAREALAATAKGEKP